MAFFGKERLKNESGIVLKLQGILMDSKPVLKHSSLVLVF